MRRTEINIWIYLVFCSCVSAQACLLVQILQNSKMRPPALFANTPRDVHFRYPETPFWDGKNIRMVEKGTHCLWKNVPTGKNGGESTKVEVFHGLCHGWERGDEGWEVLLSWDAIASHQRVQSNSKSISVFSGHWNASNSKDSQVFIMLADPI